MDERILLIENRALHAWPPQVAEPLDGWLLRRHASPSRRVNSVWPNATQGYLPLEEKIKQVEETYEHWRRPARYQVCPAAQPSDLDDHLARRGYLVEAPTNVQVAHAAVIVRENPRPQDTVLTVFDTLDLAWVAAYCRAQEAPESEIPARLAALGRIERPCVFVMAEWQGQPAAVGRGVLDAGWLGIFGMATLPAARRRGLASAILTSLAAWATDQSAEHLYLQVMQDNLSALRLYAGLGFETLYTYHYRTLATNLVR